MTSPIVMGFGNREPGIEAPGIVDARFPIAGAQAAPVPDARTVDVSVLVPAKDESGNLPEFMRQAAEAFATSDVRYEVIVIDDGSEDDTWDVLEGLAEQYAFLRLARHRVRRGIADALRTGYLRARGEVLGHHGFADH